jgi:ppGpp synthetase/RelA/SpoT-type nucleotidyltranferase
MDITQELNSFKRELKELNQSLKKLNLSNERLKNLIKKQDEIIEKKNSRRKISHIEWLNNEKKMSDLIPPE